MGAFDCFPFLPVSFIQAQEAICEIVSKDTAKGIHVDPVEYAKEVKNVGIKNWKFINPSFLEKYVKAFSINKKNSLPPAEAKNLSELIHNMISEQNYTKAAKYIHCFNVHDDFDCEKLGTTLIHRDHPEQAVELVSGTKNPALITKVINQLNPGKHNHLASDAIKSNNLSIDDFPNLKRHQVFGGLRSFLMRHDWYKTEEVALQRYHFYGDDNAMNVFVEVLKSAKMPMETYSVQIRHKDKLDKFHSAGNISFDLI